MPSVPASRCSEPGCGERAPFGQSRCPPHETERQREWHAGEHRRIYATTRWAKARAALLAEHPTCANCGERPAVDVDHREPLRELLARGGDPYDLAELDPLCIPCHSEKTAREVGLGGATL